jgi:hypothetical protein
VYTFRLMTLLRSKCVQGVSVTNDHLLLIVQFVGSHSVTSVIIIAAVGTNYDVVVLSRATVNLPTLLVTFRYVRSPDCFNEKRRCINITQSCKTGQLTLSLIFPATDINSSITAFHSVH